MFLSPSSKVLHVQWTADLRASVSASWCLEPASSSIGLLRGGSPKLSGGLTTASKQERWECISKTLVFYNLITWLMPITSYCLLVPAPTHVSVNSRMAVDHLGKAAILKACLSFPIGVPGFRAGTDTAHTGNSARCITGVLRMFAERTGEWILVTHRTHLRVLLWLILLVFTKPFFS